jgi:branched-subunit amino acid ABC-type transport system permease component
MRSSFSPFAGAERPLIAFEAVIIGGSGSLRGGFFGGRLVNAAAGRARQGFIDAPLLRIWRPGVRGFPGA